MTHRAKPGTYCIIKRYKYIILPNLRIATIYLSYDPALASLIGEETITISYAKPFQGGRLLFRWIYKLQSLSYGPPSVVSIGCSRKRTPSNTSDVFCNYDSTQSAMSIHQLRDQNNFFCMCGRMSEHNKKWLDKWHICPVTQKKRQKRLECHSLVHPTVQACLLIHFQTVFQMKLTLHEQFDFYEVCTLSSQTERVVFT